MNRRQKIVLWTGIAVIVVMGGFPPVQKTVTGFTSDVPSTHITYEFILDTHRPVAFSNILVQWIVVAIITGGLIVIFADKKPKDKQK